MKCAEVSTLKIPENITVKMNNKRPRYDEISGKYINTTQFVPKKFSSFLNPKVKQNNTNKCNAMIKQYLKALQNILFQCQKAN